jgi:hypothetical protein
VPSDLEPEPAVGTPEPEPGTEAPKAQAPRDAGAVEALEGRVRVLDADRTRRAEADRLDRRFELGEAILLSLAAILAAWAGFQAAKWSGEQADAYSRASAARVEATRSATRAGQETVVDVDVFADWLAALEREWLLDAALDAGADYAPDPDLLSGFLYERFRDEFKPAVHAWLATDPGDDPDAPETPFTMPEYRVGALAEAADLDARADAAVEDARADNEIADRYVLVTIMFATVLFFAGISSKLDTARARGLLLGVGVTLFVITTVVVLSFPKDF